jgi:hypothetical protein
MRHKNNRNKMSRTKTVQPSIFKMRMKTDLDLLMKGFYFNGIITIKQPENKVLKNNKKEFVFDEK